MIVRLATNAMGTRFELALEGESEVALRAAGEHALHEIELWHRRLSAFDPASDTSRVNRHAAGETWGHELPIDADFAEFLRLCRDVYVASDGAFDPAIGHAMESLGFRDERDASAHRGAAPSVSRPRPGFADASTFASVVVCRSSLCLAHPNLRLDFGAVGKGWALDRAADVLRDAGVSTALLHAGTSSILALGPAQQGPAFVVRVRSDVESLDLALRDGALGVSAPRGRTVEHQSRAIGHVIDPRSGVPADAARVDTAVVTGPSAALADAWSTAALVLGRSPPNLPANYGASVHTPLGWSQQILIPSSVRSSEPA